MTLVSHEYGKVVGWQIVDDVTKLNVSIKFLFSYSEVCPEDINQKAVSVAVYGFDDVY
jgi:hypothetical protein